MKQTCTLDGDEGQQNTQAHFQVSGGNGLFLLNEGIPLRLQCQEALEPGHLVAACLATFPSDSQKGSIPW